MDSRGKSKVAVVLSGGGAKGAYQIGVLKALRDRGVVPDIYCGTSVGAFNAGMLASGKTLEEVETLWRGLRRSDVFTELFAPRRFATLDFRIPLNAFLRSSRHLAAFFLDTARNGGAWWRAIDMDNQLFDITPLKEMIRANIDMEALRASGTELLITLTRLKPAGQGSTEIVGKDRITHDHILASASLPLLFPPVAIGDAEYCDGGVVMNAPLKPAIDRGAEEVYVVDLTPPPRDYHDGMMARIYQVLCAGFSAALERDLEVARNLNSQFLAAFKDARLVNRKLEIVKVKDKEGRLEPPRKHYYNYLRIYRIAPVCDIGGVEAFLDFNPAFASRLIEQGQKETGDILSNYREEEMVSPDGFPLKVVFPGVKGHHTAVP